MIEDRTLAMTYRTGVFMLCRLGICLHDEHAPADSGRHREGRGTEGGDAADTTTTTGWAEGQGAGRWPARRSELSAATERRPASPTDTERAPAR